MYYGDRDFRRCLCLSCHENLTVSAFIGCGGLSLVSGLIAACLTCGISCSSAPVLYIALGAASGGTGATAIACCCCYCNPKGLCDANSADSASSKEYYKTFNIQDDGGTETTPLSTVVASPYSTNNASTLWSTTSIPTPDGQPQRIQPISINNNP